MNTDQTNQPQSEQKKKPLEWCAAFRELGVDIDLEHFPIGNVPCYQYLTAQEFIDLSRLTQAFSLKPCTVPATEEEAPADIAPGHNPDRLTIAQVGEGWRLLEEDEIGDETLCRWWRRDEWSAEREWSTGGSVTASTRLSRAALRAARGLPHEPVAEPESDEKWAEAEWGLLRSQGRHASIPKRAVALALAAITRGRAQARTSPGEDVVREWFEATRPRIDCTLSKTYPGQYSDRDVQLAWENFLAGVRAAQNAGEGRKP